MRKIWLADCSGGTNGDVLTIQITHKEKLMPRFLYYILSSENFFHYATQNSKGAKMPRGDKKKIMQYRFPLPPIEVQQEIVRILDRFETLCNDISAGLPAEIKARQQQYEYYRDRLLKFQMRTTAENLI